MTKTPRPIPVRINNDTKTQTMRELRDPNAVYAPVDFSGNDEPILMLTTNDNMNGTWRGNNNRRTASGAIERLPSVAHVTTDFRDRRVHPRARTRYRTMITGDGNECTIVHSNSAAHLPVIEGEGRFSRDGYTQHVINKGFALGWIDVNAGCVVRQLKAGLVNPDRMLVRELVGPKAHVCAKDATTCKHLEMEREARQAKHGAAMQRIEEATAAKDPAIAIARGVAAALKADREAQGK